MRHSHANCLYPTKHISCVDSYVGNRNWHWSSEVHQSERANTNWKSDQVHQPRPSSKTVRGIYTSCMCLLRRCSKFCGINIFIIHLCSVLCHCRCWSVATTSWVKWLIFCPPHHHHWFIWGLAIMNCTVWNFRHTNGIASHLCCILQSYSTYACRIAVFIIAPVGCP